MNSEDPRPRTPAGGSERNMGGTTCPNLDGIILFTTIRTDSTSILRQRGVDDNANRGHTDEYPPQLRSG